MIKKIIMFIISCFFMFGFGHMPIDIGLTPEANTMIGIFIGAIILCILSLVIGFLFYCAIAAMVASFVSKAEEVATCENSYTGAFLKEKLYERKQQ